MDPKESQSLDQLKQLSQEHPIVFFDGVCNLCNGFVQFILKKDRKAVFRFCALQSPAGKAAQDSIGSAASATLLLLDTGRFYLRSTAALRIAKFFPLPWRFLMVLRIFPRPLRDWVYDGIALRRYRWFGKKDRCMMPTAELLSRFV